MLLFSGFYHFDCLAAQVLFVFLVSPDIFHQFRIIDKRYQKRGAMIVTSNVPLPELYFDDRLVDRLNAMTVTVKIPEYCVRAREANTRKRAILQKLGIE